MFVYQVITWLLIFNMDSALCSNSTEINGASLSEYSSTHTAGQTSNPPEYLSSSLDSTNSNDISHQPTSTLQSEPLPSTEVSQQSSMRTDVPAENRNSFDPTLVTTLSEQTTITKGILESSQTGTLVGSMTTPSESSESGTPSFGLTESPTSLLESPSSHFTPPSSVAEATSIEATPSLARSPSTLFTPLSTVAESTSIEPAPSPAESPSTLSTPPSTVAESTSIEPAPSPAESPSTLSTPPSTVAESTSIEPTPSPAESPSTLSTPPSTVAESSTLVEPSSTVDGVSVLDSGKTKSNYFTDVSVSASSMQSDELVTDRESSYADLISPSMQPSSDYMHTFFSHTDIHNNTISHSSLDDFTPLETMSSESIIETYTAFDSSSISDTFIPATDIDNNTISHSSLGDFTTLETMSSESITETNSAFDSVPISPQLSETTTATVSILTVESLESSMLSGYETTASLFPIPDSSLEYSSLTLSIDSDFTTITLSTNTLQFLDSITSPYTTTLIETIEPGIETFSPTHLTTSVTPTTKTTGLSSDITSTIPRGTESSTTAQNLPIKSSSGLSTGGKVAIGIIIPLAVIAFLILGVFFYRRYNWTRGSFKNFLQPGVHYRAYTNETFTDDDVTLGGSWRKVSDS